MAGALSGHSCKPRAQLQPVGEGPQTSFLPVASLWQSEHGGVTSLDLRSLLQCGLVGRAECLGALGLFKACWWELGLSRQQAGAGAGPGLNQLLQSLFRAPAWETP